MKSCLHQFVALAVLVTMTAAMAMAADADAGKAVYDKKCKTCHAADGNGNPGMAKVLKVTFTPMSSDEVQKKTDADLKKIITEGFQKMKPVTGLSEDDKDNVIAFIRTFKK